MKIPVHMLAFETEVGCSVQIKEVEVPQAEWDVANLYRKLDHVFHYGQNDFGVSNGHTSVSVGDVILIDNLMFLIMPLGFRKIDQLTYNRLLSVPRRDRFLVCHKIEERINKVDVALLCGVPPTCEKCHHDDANLRLTLETGDTWDICRKCVTSAISKEVYK